jgi:hypothetical protein
MFYKRDRIKPMFSTKKPQLLFFLGNYSRIGSYCAYIKNGKYLHSFTRKPGLCHGSYSETH